MAELNTLKMKAPADLWKEDLAAFTEELEVNKMLIFFFFFSIWWKLVYQTSGTAVALYEEISFNYFNENRASFQTFQCH